MSSTTTTPSLSFQKEVPELSGRRLNVLWDMNTLVARTTVQHGSLHRQREEAPRGL